MTSSVGHAGAPIPRAVVASGTGVFGASDWPVAADAFGRKSSIPWWLWPNVLSLDAPAVACVWAMLFGRASGVGVSSAAIGVLWLTVWLIYSLDRVLDGRNPDPTANGQIRHHFSCHHRTTILGCALLIAFGTFWLAVKHLAFPLVERGLALAACVGLYLLCVHAARRRMPQLIPKELAVGAIFAVGTTLPIWGGHHHAKPLAAASWILFGTLCALNCVAIECWEKVSDHASPKQCSAPILWAKPRLDLLCGATAALAAGLSVCFVAREQSTSLIAISIGALLTMVLNQMRGSLSSQALRVLADLVLVVAAVLMLVIPG